MEPKWWEGIVSFLCDYWWIILIVIGVILALVFTRNLWMSLLGL